MGFRVRMLNPEDPPASFPDPADMGIALGQPDGLLAIGGDLSPARLIEAYRIGVFPWFNEDQPILWWCPDPRAVIYPDGLHISRSLARTLKRCGWQRTINKDFTAVINACATERGKFGTWITPAMISAYRELHRLGYAHSVEIWQGEELAGGIYGIRLGNKFFGESMFTRITDGSKVALSALAELCLQEGIDLIDCQVSSPHLETLGMREIPRSRFLPLLEGLDTQPRAFAAAADGPAEVAGLAALRDASNRPQTL